MKTDNLFYRIFSTLPGLALELAGVTVANPEGYSFRAEEIKQTAFRLDGLLTPPPGDPIAPLIFLETQAQPDDDFYGRFFAEIFLYLYRTVPRPGWRALVIYPRRTAERHMRQLKRCFSYVTESLGLAVRDQAIDPIG